MTRGLLFVALLLALISVVIRAAEDVSGTWAGSFVITADDNTRSETIYMVLKQTGAELTGTAGPSADQQWPVVKGKVDGAKVEFDVQADAALVHFTLTLADGHLKGNAAAEAEGRKLSAMVDVQRKKG